MWKVRTETPAPAVNDALPTPPFAEYGLALMILHDLIVKWLFVIEEVGAAGASLPG